MRGGEWCEKHDDWFPRGCKKCRVVVPVPKPTKKELSAYDKRYAIASKEAECPKFKYFDGVYDDDKETIRIWWSKNMNKSWHPDEGFKLRYQTHGGSLKLKGGRSGL